MIWFFLFYKILKDKFTLKITIQSLSAHHMLMESRVKFHIPQKNSNEK